MVLWGTGGSEAWRTRADASEFANFQFLRDYGLSSGVYPIPSGTSQSVEALYLLA